MSQSGSRKLLLMGIVWIVVLGGAALAYRMFVHEPAKEDLVGRTSGTTRFEQHVTLALDSFSGYCIFRSSAFKEELAAAGIGLRLVDDGADYSQRIRSLKSGKTPLAVFTIDALIKASADLGELPGTIVMVIDETTGADAMIAYKQAVPNIDALNREDMRIVVTPDSPSETLARVVKANFQLPKLEADPWIEADGAEDVYRQFRQTSPSQPRAFVLWEPYVSKALEDDKAAVVIDSSRFRGYIVDVLVAERGFLLENEALVETVIKSYLTALYNERRSADGMARLVTSDAEQQQQPITSNQAARLVDTVWWKNTQENYAHFGLLSVSESRGLQHLDEMVRGINKVLLTTGAISHDPTGGMPNKLYYDKLMRRLQPNWHPLGAGEEAITVTELRPLDDAGWQRLVTAGTPQVDPIAFRRGRAELLFESRPVMDELVDKLTRFPQYYLTVTGSARAGGTPEENAANRQLALDRAQAAASYLTEKGIARQRVRAISVEELSRGGAAQSVSFTLGQTPY